MEKLALYRKYRPSDFKSIYGQKAVVQTLTNAIKHNRINHAYIFAGNKGSGKTSMAKIMSKAINCLSPVDNNPCNQCDNCLSINNNVCMDIIELDAASNSGINEIKTVIESIVFMPSQLKYKVYIIDEAHMLTNNSWNALLKTLEEPPAHAILIFATTEYHKIPATIVSRCQRYDFNKIPRDLLNKLITTVAEKEKIKIDESAVSAISLLANGAARDALSILDQLTNYANNQIDTTLINEMFGLLDIGAKINYVNAVVNSDTAATLEMISAYNQSGINFYVLINEIVQLMMDKIIYLTTKNIKLMQILDVNTVDLLVTNDKNRLLHLIDIYNDSIQKMKMSEHPKFIFEYITITACNSNPTSNFSKPNPNVVVNNVPPQIDKPSTITKEPINKFNAFKQPTNDVPTPTPLNAIGADLVLPELTDSLFNTTSKLVLQPIAPEVTKQQTVLFEAVSKTDELLQQIDADIPIVNLAPDSENNEKLQVDKPTTPMPYVINSSHEKTFDLEDIYSDEYKNTFFSIAHNHDKNKKDKFNQVFNDLKETPSIVDASMNAFLNGEKFLVISENGAVLLFDEEAQVIRFNKIAKSKTFIDLYNEHFHCQQIVIGVYKIQALGWKKEYQNLVKKEFKDVKINNVFKDEKKTVLLDILNLKELDDNDNDSER